ncbi:MAG: endopeptidase La [Lachnospiraceae bacterium]|nr:endopeptidase La [Lachnospiraceae bacterium]
MAVLPVYNILLAPNAALCIKTDTYKAMVNREPHIGDKVTVAVAKNDVTKTQLTADSFYPIGINGEIADINESGFMMINLMNRVDIESLMVLPDRSIDIEVRRHPDVEDLDEESAKPRFAAVKEAINKFSEEMEWKHSLRPYSDAWSNIGEVAVTISPWLDLSNEERYKLLAEDSQSRRFDMLEKIIFENLEIIKVKLKAQNAQEAEYQRTYKENAIRKQMEFLQKELDEMHPESMSDLRRIEIKLEESEMNETAKNEGRRILKRLKAETMNTAETGMLTDYLETLVALPWKKEGSSDIDLKKAAEILDEDHYGLKKVKKRIIEQLAVMKLKGAQTGSILLFVGPPGTGKTSIGQSIARALGREYVRVSLGGVKDESDIRGHRRTYIGAMPGRIIDSLRKCSTSDPVMVLDEVDKLSQSYNGDPASALLEVLDPEQNANFTDHYLNVPYDLSDILFVCTANSTDTIPEPLLNRMEVISFNGYTPAEKLEIAKRHLIPKSIETAGISRGKLKISDKAIDMIISEYTMESGVRGLKKRIDQICRATAVKIVSGEAESVSVTKNNLKEIMDTNPIHLKSVGDNAKPGVVTGLAWTSVGGTVLFIETMLTEGSGEIIITGRLGDVMKESARIAVSLVKNMYPDKADMFKDHDLHIHVPDGATPKDGPSAGITLTTALSSLVTGIPVTPKAAMTGEVSLQGRVKPIGGLPEKLMAAHRAGVKKVFIPKDNIDDLRDVAEEVKESLEILPVDEVEDVLKELKLK